MQIINVALTVVSGFLCRHDEMLATAKRRFGLNRSYLQRGYENEI